MDNLHPPHLDTQQKRDAWRQLYHFQAKLNALAAEADPIHIKIEGTPTSPSMLLILNAPSEALRAIIDALIPIRPPKPPFGARWGIVELSEYQDGNRQSVWDIHEPTGWRFVHEPVLVMKLNEDEDGSDYRAATAQDLKRFPLPDWVLQRVRMPWTIFGTDEEGDATFTVTPPCATESAAIIHFHLEHHNATAQWAVRGDAKPKRTDLP